VTARTARLPIAALLLLTSQFVPDTLLAIPPYRATDAETVEPWHLNTRLGLLRVRHDGSDTAYITPLLRLELGLPASIELRLNYQHRADAPTDDELAVGFKWVPIHWRVDVGIDTLTLLPVGSEETGGGVQSQLVATYRHDAWQAHINAGGIYDARESPTQSGWRTSGLVEYRIGRWKPGVELFVRRLTHDDLEVITGPGVIIDMGRFDLRIGVEAGLTDVSPDVATNIWLGTTFDLH